MTSRVINDPSALGWEYDPDTGRWTWGGHSSSGGGGGGSFPEAPVDGEQYARQNAGWSVVEHPEGGTGGGGDYVKLVSASSQYMDGSDNRLEWGTQGNDRGPYYTVIGQGSGVGAGLDAAAFYVETDNGSYEINNVSMYVRGGKIQGSHGSTIAGFTSVQATDFLDKDGNSIIGAGGGGTVTTADVQLTNPTTFMPNGMATQEDANAYIEEELQKIIPDAPANGTIYGRQNNNWVSVPTGGGGSGGNDPRITDTQISDDNWDTAYGWGNHKSQGYLTSASLSGYATQSWVSSNYQPKGNYLTSFTESDPTVPAHVKSISQADINKWNNPPAGGGGTDTFDDVLKRGSSSTVSPSAPNWQCLSNTYTLGGVNGSGARIISYDGQFKFYNATSVESGTINTNGNFGGTSFTSNVGNAQLLTMYGNAVANSTATGAGLYFSQTAPSPTITPCRGSDFAQRDNFISLGNPSYRFFKVYSVNGVAATRRHTQNDGEAVLSVKDLIEVFETLREATREEKTMEGLRDSIGNCVGGIVERLEAIQAATDEQTAQEIAMYAENEDEPMPPFPTEPLSSSVE